MTRLTTKGQTGTILLAQNEPRKAALLQLAIAELGWQNPVKIVPDGPSVIAYLRGDDAYRDRSLFPVPVLLLLELDLPGLDGLALLKWLETHSQYKSFHVVVLIGAGDTRRADQAYQCGASSFLVQPVATGELRSTLEKLRVPLSRPAKVCGNDSVTSATPQPMASSATPQ